MLRRMEGNDGQTQFRIGQPRLDQILSLEEIPGLREIQTMYAHI